MKLESALLLRMSELGLGIVGRTLFHSHMPAEVVRGTLLMARVPILIDPYTGLRKGTFQVICRGLEIEEAHNKATEIIKGVVSEGVIVGDVNFRFIKAINEPLVFPRTPGAQFEASVNYDFAASWE